MLLCKKIDLDIEEKIARLMVNYSDSVKKNKKATILFDLIQPTLRFEIRAAAAAKRFF